MSTNDSARSKLAPGLAMMIEHAQPRLAIRNDITISLRRLDENDYDDGIDIPIAVLLEDKPDENSFSIWLYDDGSSTPKEIWVNESFPCVIPMLTKYIKTAVEQILRERGIEGFSDDWYFDNTSQVRASVARLCELWEGIAHRGVRDVDGDLTIPCLWD